MENFERFPLTIYNSLSRKKEAFTPINAPFVGLYVCGPTVYSEVHIGNMRSFITFDVLFRYLSHLGYKVRYVRNLTDVGHMLDDDGEDRVLKRARLEKLEPMEVVQKYSNYFHDVCKQFKLLPPSIEPTATAHIIEQIQMAQKILDQGMAYVSNGSVYFDVEAFDKKHGYGALSGRKIDELQSNSRKLDGQDEKRSPLDFALWKNAGPEHIMRWPSPWGEGFPGWHLECSVMSTKYLGETFDIHGGGMDLKFPHHECEVAQNVASSGEAPVRYWMHANMLTMNGTKMSKSLGNAISIEELINGGKFSRAFSEMSIRFFLLQAHYSSTVDISESAIEAAEKGFERLQQAWKALINMERSSGEANMELDAATKKLLDQVYVELSNDLNTPKAIAVLFDLASTVNSIKNQQIPGSSLTEETLSRLKLEFPKILEDILGLKLSSEAKSDHLDGVLELMIRMRNQARADRNFALADQIRDQLKDAGVELKDGKNGTEYELN